MRLRKLFSVLALASGLSAAGPVLAYQTQMLFQQKHWKVDIHAWDDGKRGCRAVVGSNEDNFAIWIFSDASFQFQFYSGAWDFGAGQKVDLEMRVDTRPRWDLPASEVGQNSVTFALRDRAAADLFLQEIARGNRLYLRDKDGRELQNYSLMGSRNSIKALDECSAVITGANDKDAGETGATSAP